MVSLVVLHITGTFLDVQVLDIEVLDIEVHAGGLCRARYSPSRQT